MADLAIKTVNMSERWPFMDLSLVDIDKDPKMKRSVLRALDLLIRDRKTSLL